MLLAASVLFLFGDQLYTCFFKRSTVKKLSSHIFKQKKENWMVSQEFWDKNEVKPGMVETKFRSTIKWLFACDKSSANGVENLNKNKQDSQQSNP